MRCVHTDVKLSLNRRQLLEGETKQLLQMLSYHRILAMESETQSQLLMEFVFHYLIRECTSKESLDFLKSLLNHSDLSHHYRLQL